MGIEDITQKILEDTRTEADKIISVARESAEKIIDDAKRKARSDTDAAKEKIDARNAAYTAGVEASARQESAKILLAARRKILDEIYDKALKSLKALGVEDTVELCEALLEKYAENGDEIVFASGFSYVREVEALKVVKEKDLRVSFDKNDEIDGGFMLKGKNADKDLSFATLLADDRKENETEIARRIFNTD